MEGQAATTLRSPLQQVLRRGIPASMSADLAVAVPDTLNLPYLPPAIPRLFQRLTGRAPRRNAYVDTYNALAAGRFGPAVIAEIAQRYAFDPVEEFAADWEALLEEVVLQLARDGVFDDEERAFLKAYVRVLRVPKEAGQRAYRRGARRAFHAIVMDQFNAGALDRIAERRLKSIARTFGLKDTALEGGIRSAATAHVRAFADDILSDGMVSDAQKAEFEQLVAALDIDQGVVTSLRRRLADAHERWAVVRGTPPSTRPTDLRLPKGEAVYFRGAAEWHETRKADGVEALQRLATGQLLLTDRRAMFIADRGDNKSVPWEKTVRLRASGDMLEFERERGKSPVIRVTTASFGRLDVLPQLARRLWSESV